MKNESLKQYYSNSSSSGIVEVGVVLAVVVA